MAAGPGVAELAEKQRALAAIADKYRDKPITLSAEVRAKMGIKDPPK
jgi:hypothetical protein